MHTALTVLTGRDLNAPAVRRQRRTTEAQADSPASSYAAGKVRAATDKAVSPTMTKATRAYPRALDVLGYEGLAQTASWLDDDRRAVMEQMREAGVPTDWHRPESDDEDVRWSDYS